MTRTPDYQFTVTDKKDPRLLALRVEVNARNAEHRKKNEPLEVVALVGRLGKDNPNRDQMINKYGVKKSAVPHGIAVRFDVYLRKRGMWTVTYVPPIDREARRQAELERLAIRDGRNNWIRRELDALIERGIREKGIAPQSLLEELNFLTEERLGLDPDI